MAQQPSLFKRLFSTLAVTATVVAVAMLVFSACVFQMSAVDDAHDMLAQEVRLFADTLSDSEDPAARLASYSLDNIRVTVVEPDGEVSFDSFTTAGELENHADRPEIQQALETGTGSSERASETLGEVSIYEAARLSNGSVLRLSVDLASAISVIFNEAWLLLFAGFGIIVASWVIARIVARRIVSPILAIDPADPEASASYAEISPLIGKISSQQAELERQLEELKGADAMRREFTANVTHELKTPLASISGAAELIRAGLVRPDDVQNFAGRIYDEAQRLTMLVNDILTLSKMDESERSRDRAYLGEEEPVDLMGVASDVADRLRSSAKKRQVAISVEGEPLIVKGLPRLLDELVSNLCDNAVRYNRPGGTVKVRLYREDGRPVLSVADTGIGIPEESQAKVFERFYRVDPSRTRESGGTGLGLAIVKHAVLFHKADLSLESKVGEGTTITVRFPKADVPVPMAS